MNLYLSLHLDIELSKKQEEELLDFFEKEYQKVKNDGGMESLFSLVRYEEKMKEKISEVIKIGNIDTLDFASLGTLGKPATILIDI